MATAIVTQGSSQTHGDAQNNPMMQAARRRDAGLANSVGALFVSESCGICVPCRVGTKMFGPEG